METENLRMIFKKSKNKDIFVGFLPEDVSYEDFLINDAMEKIKKEYIHSILFKGIIQEKLKNEHPDIYNDFFKLVDEREKIVPIKAPKMPFGLSDEEIIEIKKMPFYKEYKKNREKIKKLNDQIDNHSYLSVLKEMISSHKIDYENDKDFLGFAFTHLNNWKNDFYMIEAQNNYVKKDDTFIGNLKIIDSMKKSNLKHILTEAPEGIKQIF